MFLRGIVVYKINDEGDCELSRTSDDRADTAYSFFTPKKSDLSALFEATMLFKRHSRCEFEHAYHEQVDHCHFYAKKAVIKDEVLPDGSSHCSFYLVGLLSKSQLYQDDEFQQLMRNIQYVFARQLISKKDKPAFTLADIVGNPLRFTQQDLLSLEAKEQVANDPSISAVKSELAKVKEVMLKNIEDVLERGDRLEVLLAQTKELDDTANLFRSSSKALNDQNSCTGRCGGWFSGK